MQSANVSINQVTNCFKNLTCKYLQNDYLDYKSRSIHGRTQFNSNLAHHKQDVQKWCNHCLNMGIRTPEDFAHAVFYCPQVQYILHEIQSDLKLENWEISASNCILSTNRPPNAIKSELTDCQICDLIWIICHKTFLKSRIKKENVDINLLKKDIKTQFKTIIRCYPNDPISERLKTRDLLTLLNSGNTDP